MSEQAREQIKEILEMAYRQDPNDDTESVSFSDFWADRILSLLKELGYRKVPELKEVLMNLWGNDDSVPTPFNFRCSELDWFSQGIKDNIVAHIAIKIFGFEEAKALLDEDNLNQEAD